MADSNSNTPLLMRSLALPFLYALLGCHIAHAAPSSAAPDLTSGHERKWEAQFQGEEISCYSALQISPDLKVGVCRSKDEKKSTLPALFSFKLAGQKSALAKLQLRGDVGYINLFGFKDSPSPAKIIVEYGADYSFGIGVVLIDNFTGKLILAGIMPAAVDEEGEIVSAVPFLNIVAKGSETEFCFKKTIVEPNQKGKYSSFLPGERTYILRADKLGLKK